MSIVVVASNAQRGLLWLKMSFPLIGAKGKVPKKEPMTHIDRPASPTAVKPAFISRKNSPAKAKPMRISAAEVMAPNRSVNFSLCTLRVGEENGTLKVNVVKRKRTSPKGQIECSLHTPLLRRYTIEENFWTKPTMKLVAKKTGSSNHIWLMVMTLTYAKETPKTIIDTM